LHFHSLCASLDSCCSCLVITFAEMLAVIASDKRFGLLNLRNSWRWEDNGKAWALSVFRSPSYSYSIPARYVETARVRAPTCVSVNVDDITSPGTRSVINRGSGGGFCTGVVLQRKARVFVALSSSYTASGSHRKHREQSRYHERYWIGLQDRRSGVCRGGGEAWVHCGHVTYLMSAWQQAAVFVPCRQCRRVNCVQFARCDSVTHVRGMRHMRRTDNETGCYVYAGCI
jgi:hypothetical protein